VCCVFLGFNPHQKGYRCYHPSTHHIYVSMDVTFSETKYFFGLDQSPLVLRGSSCNKMPITGLIFPNYLNRLVHREAQVHGSLIQGKTLVQGKKDLVQGKEWSQGSPVHRQLGVQGTKTHKNSKIDILKQLLPLHKSTSKIGRIFMR